jgi:hypothetical protein
MLHAKLPYLRGMKAKTLIRPIDAAHRLGCGLDRFRRQYVLSGPGEPLVAGSKLKRLEPVKLYFFWRGLRLCQLKKPMTVFVEAEVDALAVALARASTRRPVAGNLDREGEPRR